ncbi:MAG: hypothetical protein GKC04_02580 [Methanomicrobiales archaeon]|nr:hypothetical protein [Methanomicrobiales archaeon]
MKQCSSCKGRGFCGLARCPVTSRFYASLAVKTSSEYTGSAPSVFIGTAGHPRPRGGPLMVGENDNPEDWMRRQLSMDDIVGVRARTIRGVSGQGAAMLPLQEIALSGRPVDVDVAFEKPVRFDLSFDGTLAPVGLLGTIRTLTVLDNAHVERSVDRITSDTDFKAVDAVRELYREGVDVHRIQQLLSTGLLGVRRKIVPTRWAITAVDDMIAQGTKRLIRQNSRADCIRIHSTTLFGNQIICLLIPGNWAFEMIEIWEPDSLWGGQEPSITRDGEDERGKRGYSPIAGAYYSARLAVLDHLARTGRSASAVVIRRVTQEYWAPLGTWVIREASRAALNKNGQECPDLGTASDAVTELLGSPQWRMHSTLIGRMISQKSLFDFIPG